MKQKATARAGIDLTCIHPKAASTDGSGEYRQSSVDRKYVQGTVDATSRRYARLELNRTAPILVGEFANASENQLSTTHLSELL